MRDFAIVVVGVFVMLATTASLTAAAWVMVDFLREHRKFREEKLMAAEMARYIAASILLNPNSKK